MVICDRILGHVVKWATVCHSPLPSRPLRNCVYCCPDAALLLNEYRTRGSWRGSGVRVILRHNVTPKKERFCQLSLSYLLITIVSIYCIYLAYEFASGDLPPASLTSLLKKSSEFLLKRFYYTTSNHFILGCPLSFLLFLLLSKLVAIRPNLRSKLLFLLLQFLRLNFLLRST